MHKLLHHFLKRTFLFVIYSLGGPKQLNSLLSTCFRLPSKIFSNALPKYQNYSKEWSDFYHKIDFAHDPLSLRSSENSQPAVSTTWAFPEAAETHRSFENHYSVFLSLQFKTFSFSAENVLTIPAFSFSFTACIDIFLTLCSLCILFSTCRAIKPTLDSAVEFSHALIPQKKELEYKRHFTEVLTVVICD